MFYYLIVFLVLITGLFCLAYVFLIGAFCLGWKNTETLKKRISKNVHVAVILPARNEEDNIEECLNAIFNQTYPGSNFELIVINDNSTDKTADIIEKYSSQKPNIRLLNLADYFLEGKKNAITIAIDNTNAELIITTDADCTMGPDWLQSIVSFYDQTNAEMIVAPIAFKDEDGFFQKMQSLEMIALMGSTAGALSFGKAIMCNGANLAYTKKVFKELKGFEGIEEKPTGDDVLLMYKVNYKHKNAVKFLKNEESIVYTKAKRTLSDFIQQRKRWVSKDMKMLNHETIWVSIVVYLFNIMILLVCSLTSFASIKSVIYLPFLEISLILLGIKCVIDFLLLFLAASFFKKKILLSLFIPEQLIYIIYVVVIGFPGNKKSFSWKGRKY
jgi:cellulose synthase/poly-beta-1,6-N-acetylglucosamine synthase-like glycosyltransferase